eukprot:1142048-Pelagomonas_calceolata.AAC.4
MASRIHTWKMRWGWPALSPGLLLRCLLVWNPQLCCSRSLSYRFLHKEEKSRLQRCFQAAPRRRCWSCQRRVCHLERVLPAWRNGLQLGKCTTQSVTQQQGHPPCEAVHNTSECSLLGPGEAVHEDSCGNGWRRVIAWLCLAWGRAGVGGLKLQLDPWFESCLQLRGGA